MAQITLDNTSSPFVGTPQSGHTALFTDGTQLYLRTGLPGGVNILVGPEQPGVTTGDTKYWDDVAGAWLPSSAISNDNTNVDTVLSLSGEDGGITWNDTATSRYSVSVGPSGNLFYYGDNSGTVTGTQIYNAGRTVSVTSNFVNNAPSGIVVNPHATAASVLYTGGRCTIITGVNSSQTLSADQYLYEVSGTSYTVLLPASPNIGDEIAIKLDGTASLITVDGNSNNIQGSPTFPLNSAYDSLRVYFNGTEWLIEP